MKIRAETEVTLELYPKSGYSKIGKLIDRFRDSSYVFIEIVDYPHVNAYCLRESIANSLRRRRIKMVGVLMIDDQIFLVKKKV